MVTAHVFLPQFLLRVCKEKGVDCSDYILPLSSADDGSINVNMDVYVSDLPHVVIQYAVFRTFKEELCDIIYNYLVFRQLTKYCTWDYVTSTSVYGEFGRIMLLKYSCLNKKPDALAIIKFYICDYVFSDKFDYDGNSWRLICDHALHSMYRFLYDICSAARLGTVFWSTESSRLMATINMLTISTLLERFTLLAKLQ